MDRTALLAILKAVQDGSRTPEQAAQELAALPTRRLGLVSFDAHRAVRRGVGEVVFAPGKADDQLVDAARAALDSGQNCMVTRVSSEAAAVLRDTFGDPGFTHHAAARVVTIVRRPIADQGRGTILVMTAGTSDTPVAEEAAVACEFFGNRVVRAWDVGVAGIHRLVDHLDAIGSATVIIVAAGMEGALPSVVAGLAPCPVVAVPTSIGYGASFGGVAALLAMLNSCAGGVSVVNIDNGFGAAMTATLINRRRDDPTD
jgi:NCAIR mutase (PurE)-related protein